jgi:hypothetical protein
MLKKEEADERWLQGFEIEKRAVVIEVVDGFAFVEGFSVVWVLKVFVVLVIVVVCS